MSERSDRQSLRMKMIVQALQQTGQVNVKQLCDRFNASVATIRRDLLHLEVRGLLRRNHGGAVSIEPLFYEPFKKDATFLDFIERNAAEKRRIGMAAAAHVPYGSSILLTPGTTTNEVVRNLAPDSGIKVTTNAVNVAMELSKRKDIDVYLAGGHLRGDWFSLVGPTTVENLRRTFVDIVFVGANAVDAFRGLTCYNPEEAEVNKAMIEQAKRKIAVADASKLGQVADWAICKMDRMDLLITDSTATDEQIQPFKDAGVSVERA